MLLPRKWRNLALGMITVTILCNLLVLKQMPDSSSRTIRAVTRPEEQHEDAAQPRESISRKLGSTKGSSFSGSTGVLKRWILSGDKQSKQRNNTTVGQSDKQQAQSGELASEASLEHETSEQLYNSHPRFGQQNLAARSSSKQAAKEPAPAQDAQQLEASEQLGDIASSLVSNASNARPQNLVQLAEAFRQQQEQVAAAVKATQKPADNTNTAQPVIEGLNRAPAIEHVPEGKAPVIELSPSPPSTGLPAQNVQAYPGQSPLLQQQQGLELSNATEERTTFSSAAGSGDTVVKAADSSVDASAAQQQVLADVATKPKAPVDEGKEDVPALQTPPQNPAQTSTHTSAQNVTVDPSCFDEEAGCLAWAEDDGCIQTGPAFMLEKCRRSCGVCGRPYTRRSVDKVTLNNGVEMPLVGFGSAGLGPDTKQAVKWALEAGYRLIDSAQAQEWYREDLVGQAVIESGIPREELFLTSKLHPRHHGYDAAMIQFTKSLSSLAVEYVDLFLLHYPACWPELCGAGVVPAGRWQDSWKALETLVDKGLIRAIGVSNFDIDELAELLAMARIKPALVQRHSDPLSADFATQALCQLAGVQYQGYSTLGSQWLKQGHVQNLVLDNAVVRAIAQELGREPAQVVLKWALQHGQAVVPRSSKQERIAANRVLDFELTDKHMRRIDALDSIITPEAV